MSKQVSEEGRKEEREGGRDKNKYRNLVRTY